MFNWHWITAEQGWFCYPDDRTTDTDPLYGITRGKMGNSHGWEVTCYCLRPMPTHVGTWWRITDAQSQAAEHFMNILTTRILGTNV